jgi:hypothetical protein
MNTTVPAAEYWTYCAEPEVAGDLVVGVGTTPAIVISGRGEPGILHIASFGGVSEAFKYTGERAVDPRTGRSLRVFRHAFA